MPMAHRRVVDPSGVASKARIERGQMSKRQDHRCASRVHHLTIGRGKGLAGGGAPLLLKIIPDTADHWPIVGLAGVAWLPRDWLNAAPTSPSRRCADSYKHPAAMAPPRRRRALSALSGAAGLARAIACGRPRR